MHDDPVSFLDVSTRRHVMRSDPFFCFVGLHLYLWYRAENTISRGCGDGGGEGRGRNLDGGKVWLTISPAVDGKDVRRRL